MTARMVSRGMTAKMVLAAVNFSRRLRLDRERVNASSQFLGQRRINHAVTLEPALPFEGGRHDINPEMCLAARPMAGMALMQM